MIALAARTILEIDKITLPFIIIILGSPGSGKTTIILLIKSLGNEHFLDNFTPKSIVSHFSAKSEEELRKSDLLPKIKDKIFLTPDLAPIFSIRDDSLGEIIGIITRLADGQGYISSSGVHGDRGYGKTFFVWTGASVEISKKIWDMIARLGPKMFFLRIDKDMSIEAEEEKILGNMDDGNDYYLHLDEVMICLKQYWDAIISFPLKNNGKIVWDSQKDSPIAKRMIIRYAQFLARLRGYVPTERTEGLSGRSYAYGEPIIEDPERATHYLYNLVRGYALDNGRNYIIEDDVKIVEQVVFSSAQKEIVEMMKLLIENEGQLTTSQIMQFRKITDSTALRITTKMVVLGLVDEVKVAGSTKNFIAIRLKEEFRWLIKGNKN